MADTRVQSAISHWAPRFVANGNPLTDFQEVTVGEHVTRAAANDHFSNVVLVVDYEQIRAKCKTQEEARGFGATLSLDGIAGKIACPLCDRPSRWLSFKTNAKRGEQHESEEIRGCGGLRRVRGLRVAVRC